MPKTRISCPNCRQPVAAEIEQLIDLNADPSLKQKLLSGAINYIQCPACRFQGNLPTVLIYHDPDKELLLTFVPAEMGLPRNEQERVVGGFINQVVNRLPTEKRKGYLLRPQQAFTYQGLIERVLEADGITKEMIAAQQNRLRLIQRLIEAPPETLEQIARQEDALMDAEFFMMLRQLTEAAAASNERQTVEMLVNLQKVLIPLTTFGKDAQAKSAELEAAVKELQAAGEKLSRADLLNMVINAPNETRLQAYVSLARPVMDYTFFQMLSEKIDRARGDGRTRLVDLREKLLELTKQVDEEMALRQEEAFKLLNQIITDKNVREAAIKNLPRFDDFFAMVLNRELESARKTGDLEKSAKYQEIIAVIQEANAPPPEVAIIEELLSAENEQQMQALLEQHAADITPEFMEMLAGFSAQIDANEEKELAQRLAALNRLAIRFSMAKNLRG